MKFLSLVFLIVGGEKGTCNSGVWVANRDETVWRQTVDVKLDAVDKKLEELKVLLEKHTVRTDALSCCCQNDTSITAPTTTAAITTSTTTPTSSPTNTTKSTATKVAMEVVDGAMQAVDGAIDNAKNAMDNAIHRIKKEVKLQKMKSNSMCRLKTAHNWQEVKEKVEDPDAPSYFWRAHTVTVLLVLICYLVYTALIENPVEDSTYSGKRGFVAALFFWVTLGMTIIPDGPFLRPHPALWRFTFAFGVFYELLLIYILFQTPVDARKLLK